MKGYLIGIAVATLATGSADAALKGAALARGAKISLTAARVIALKARPGKIVGQELEREQGGSGLRYSFDITSTGKSYEVGVDAVTAAVLEDVRQGAHPD